ncbi:chromate transporter-domain-containing protein [Fusarium oxysporum Fo47]|uniref:chromate transporter-domain-containing protein n=1 Tax=Fusarium oxysporum Fo47 TaxID=660027 RepID=UPI00286990C1|nr:chromate transporter-domain-containing protein [Fusarium oxysporum Fo47]QKD56768.2 chromate transporter-domain-containing protein [Fusarium oxysporum Fo47]
MAAELTPSQSVATKLHDKKVDEESQKVESFQPDCSGPTSNTPHIEDDQGLEDNSNVPKLSYPKLFWFFFYNFGLFAWGGPVAQIALIKERLVVQDKWITLPRFQRVFSVYQILPGPEAAELCGIIAGMAFILPGFALMLLASYLYTLAGFENKYFNASFRALQPIVAAMILRATHKIADHSVRKHDTRKVDPFLVIAAICTAINGALRINIFISLGLYGIIYTFIARRLWIPAAALFILQYVGYALYVVFRGVPSPVSLALGIAKTPSLINLFVLGLVAGTLSFGGAYTAIPFVQVEAVLMGAWLPQSVFIDGIAIGNILPAPLVIFATFVGFQGAYLDGSIGNAFAGAIIITLGMFFPCFLFTIAGHELLEKLVRNKFLASFFDGLCGSVIGVIAIIAAQILKASIVGSLERVKDKPIGDVIDTTAQVGPAAVLYMLALAVLYKFTNKYTALLLVIMGAVAGQFLFVD